ncbi:MAG: hypothetical protein A3C53_08160 [Omnitrophica WOR_2 bacterium RIFCSPHIGHO2_02_FULL_68_15]|nr:MAG: hypothetical protein A3C53_08160 [Omnitrophica WOR_2 bacterium RIFCSPHIGHO2_02_FULL_68_15]
MVIVRNEVQIFVTEAARTKYSDKLDALRLQASQQLGPALTFQTYEPGQTVPDNATVLTDSDARPTGLRDDAAAINVATVRTFLDVLWQATNYQLGLPPTEALTGVSGAMQVGKKTFIFA